MDQNKKVHPDFLIIESKLMRNFILFMFLTISFVPSMVSQNAPSWGIRAGYSPFTEDNWGFGIAFRPDNSRWFHHLELYPIQNRASDIVTEAKNAGFLVRTNYLISKPERFFQLFTGAEVYGYQYSRKILGSIDLNTDQVVQVMGHVGANLRLGKRINLNIVLPLIGFEHVRSEDLLGVSNHTTPYFVGFYGTFLPKFGVDIGIF